METVRVEVTLERESVATQGHHPMNADVLTTRVVDALERNLFLKLCISEPALARMRAYEEEHITSPSGSIVVQARSASHD
jgi:hypothetical protein